MVAWIAVEAGVGAGFMIGDYIYHRITDEKPAKDRPAREFSIPHADDGAPFGIIYGRTRIRNPVLAWHGNPRSEIGSVDNASPDAERIYLMDMFFVLGIAMNDGNGSSGISALWSGENKFQYVAPLAELKKTLDSDDNVVEVYHGGSVEVLDGDPLQELTDSVGSASTNIAGRMISDSTPAIAGTEIPGYRGFLSVGLYGSGAGRWSLGANATVPAYSFEGWSYEDANGYPAVGTYARIGYDLNPINALWDLLKAKRGKSGIDPTLYIDSDSFSAAATTLKNETHGYSRFIDQSKPLDEHVAEILKQIDAILYVNESTKKYVLKLIRNDYNPRDVPHITKDNCDEIEGFAAGGWQGLANIVRVVFPNRDLDYNDDSAVATQASFSDQNNEEIVLSFPGCPDPTLAQRLARRELAARSRPLMKMSAIVDRSFVRANPGDVVKVTLSNPDIAGLMFRVVDADRGTLENGKIRLDLIQDYFYTYRQIPPQPPGLDHPDIGNIQVKIRL